MTPIPCEMRFDLDIYNVDSILQASYKFTDRCYLHIRRENPTQIVVEFRPRDANTLLDKIMGEFANEVIDQQVRATVSVETRQIRERIYEQAFAEVRPKDVGDGH